MSFRNKANGLLGVATRCLGEPVVYSAAGCDPVAIKAVWDGVYEEVDPNTGAIVVSTKPSVSVRDSDLPQPPAQGDTLTDGDQGYRVIEVQTDGQGGSKLLLHKI